MSPLLALNFQDALFSSPHAACIAPRYQAVPEFTLFCAALYIGRHHQGLSIDTYASDGKFEQSGRGGTVAMYVKPDGWSSSSNSQDRVLAHFGTSLTTDSGASGNGVTGSILFVYTTDLNLDVIVDLVVDDSSGEHEQAVAGQVTLVSNPPFDDGFWGHLALTWSMTSKGNVVQAFFDGVEYDPKTVAPICSRLSCDDDLNGDETLGCVGRRFGCDSPHHDPHHHSRPKLAPNPG